MVNSILSFIVLALLFTLLRTFKTVIIKYKFLSISFQPDEEGSFKTEGIALNLRELKKQLRATKDDAEKTRIKGEIASLVDIVDSKIRQSGREISYNIREWSIEMIIQKFSEGLEEDRNELFIPDYQRDYKWPPKVLSRFVESILLDFPIPYLYIADIDEPDNPEMDGRVEIIDGSQRIRALHYFVNSGVRLKDTKEIAELEGFQFNDFSAARKRRFMRATLRFVELKGQVDEDTRRDLFERINSGAKSLLPMEVRHGSQDADTRFFKEVITANANSELFEELAPLSKKKKASQDHLELVLRFFAYLNDIESYKGTVRPFLDQYLAKAGQISSDEEIQRMNDEFINTLNFIQTHIPMGFRRTPNSKTTIRARYEALAVGVGLALRESPELTPAVEISSWITSDEFQQVIGADSANNTSQLVARIEFVKTKLLEG
ncbi:DUF262 domain-containing protein [Pseudoalteromonas sp. MMG024]|uniref:DUF262 domain-containing protein n=1 Tax=Pseudoalteromonas sp. MMG024 TaxID=2909980 RepID=UPI001F23BA58|nr:DUF262 domain-containing protein [Pseudoalteromonas sp. MMG024]MCF6458730.1 DUF262 domain-containing protein [Pseudoalteromonas sp. MMG024]